MAENQLTSAFIPFLDFNDPVLADIDQRIRPFLKHHPHSLSRELQIRSLIYRDFNRYLTGLLHEADQASVNRVLQSLDEDADKDVLISLSRILKQAPELIINNFIQLFHQATLK